MSFVLIQAPDNSMVSSMEQQQLSWQQPQKLSSVRHTPSSQSTGLPGQQSSGQQSPGPQSPRRVRFAHTAIVHQDINGVSTHPPVSPSKPRLPPKPPNLAQKPIKPTSEAIVSAVSASKLTVEATVQCGESPVLA